VKKRAVLTLATFVPNSPLGPFSLRALARQDDPVAEDLVFALSAVVGAGELEGNPGLPTVRFAGEIEL
jgi:hypothetical protein